MANSTAQNATTDVERRLSGLPEQIQHWYEEADRMKDEAKWTVGDNVMELYDEAVKNWPKSTPGKVGFIGLDELVGSQPLPGPPDPGDVVDTSPDNTPSPPPEGRDALKKVIGERPSDVAGEDWVAKQDSIVRSEDEINETVRSESASAFAVDSDDPDPGAPNQEDSRPPKRDMRPLVKTPEVPKEIPPTALALMAAAGLSFVAILMWILSKTGLLARMGPTGPLAGLFSRQSGMEVLQSPVRARIHAAVTHESGITFTKLRQAMDMPPSTLRYHLAILRREDLIKVTRRGGILHYHDAGARADGQARARENLFWRNRGLLAYTILQHPGANRKAVARITGLLPSRVSEYTKELADAGLVRSERVGRCRQYFPTPMLQAMMASGQVPTSRG